MVKYSKGDFMKTLKKLLIFLLIAPLTYYFLPLQAKTNNLEVFYFNDTLSLEEIDFELYDLENNFLVSFSKDESFYNDVVWHYFWLEDFDFKLTEYILKVNLPGDNKTFNLELKLTNDALKDNTYKYYLKEKFLTTSRDALQTKITYATFTSRKEIKFYSNFKLSPDEVVLLQNNTYYEGKYVKTFSPQNQHVITLSDDLNFTKEHYLEVTTNDGFPQTITIIRHDKIYNQGFFTSLFAYDGNDLGATYSTNSTTFKVWAPTLSEITLNLYSSDNIKESLKMTYEDKYGLFTYTKYGNLKNFEYTYSFTRNGEKHEIIDPYAKYVSENNRAVIIDLNSTNPPGFKNWQPTQNHTGYKDYIVYESSISQLTSNLKETNLQNTFGGLTEKNLTVSAYNQDYSSGLDHLKELGITHLSLSDLIDTKNSFSIINNKYKKDQSVTAEIKELKQSIKSLDEHGINVVLDLNFFNKIIPSLESLMPGYYYENNFDDTVSSKEEKAFFETNHYMVNKYFESQLTYLVSEFKFSGLKISPLNSLNIDFVNALLRELELINDDFLIYGEFSEKTPQNIDNKLTAESLDQIRDVGFIDDNRFSLEKDFLTSSSNTGLKGYILSSWSQDYNTLSPRQSFKNLARFSLTALNENKQVKTIQLLSYGVPVIKGGEEIGYNSREKLIYEDKHNNSLFNTYKTLIDFRKQHPSLMFSSHSDIKNNVIYDVKDDVVFYRIINKDDLYPDILILHNFGNKQNFNLPVGLPNTSHYNRDGVMEWQIAFDNLDYYPLKTKYDNKTDIELQKNQSVILHFGLNKDNIIENPIKVPEPPKSINIIYYLLAFGVIIIAGGITIIYFILKSTDLKDENL